MQMHYAVEDADADGVCFFLLLTVACCYVLLLLAQVLGYGARSPAKHFLPPLGSLEALVPVLVLERRRCCFAHHDGRFALRVQPPRELLERVLPRTFC